MKKPVKIFVLDTSTIGYDIKCIQYFEHHDIVIPIIVLEELDGLKKRPGILGADVRAFNRKLRQLAQGKNFLKDWISIGAGHGRIKVQRQRALKSRGACEEFGDKKNDHKIIDTALYIQEKYPDREVILVTMDINLEVKASSLGLRAENLKAHRVSTKSMYNPKNIKEDISPDNIDRLYKDGFATDISSFKIDAIKRNEYFILRDGKKTAMVFANPLSKRLELLTKQPLFKKIAPMNAEQIFAVHALLNKDVRVVTLQGVAGTGKTLLSLAAALEQKKDYHQIYLARPVVPLSNKDIGYLPGDANQKLNPYMQPLWDNLKFIKSLFKETSRDAKNISALIENDKLMITPLAYIRGRSISNVYFIVDEAQNLTPHEVKTIITRAGEGTKIVFTGDVNQIDAPYLDTSNNGLSVLIEKTKNEPLVTNIVLEKGERSDLANLANKIL